MTVDRRPLWRPFSEAQTEQAAPGDGRRLLPAAQADPFQEPPPVDPEHQVPAPSRRRLDVGRLTFSSPAGTTTPTA